ncbi:MAG: hypothetical protein IH961_09650 [Chloroflexi bacterium]|nr:hypothetical protein [Chloroflexota bacterium]
MTSGEPAAMTEITLAERRRHLRTTANPDQRQDYVVSLTGALRLDFLGRPVDATMRYVPDTLTLERAEFTAYLPIDRKTAVLSKLITALGVCVVLLAVMSVIAWLLTPSDMWPDEAGLFLSTAIPLFGVAWLFSSFVRTPAMAAAIGIAFSVGLGFTCLFFSELEPMQKTDMGTVFLVVSIAVGLSCFAAGVVHYLRRVEP